MSRDALVVGVNTYQYLSGLQAPARDAEAIAQQLHTQGEFRIHRLPEIISSGQPQVGLKTPVTLRDLETALVNLFKPKGSNVPHTALFYFSGHGIQREAGIQEGYLAPSDSNPDVGFYGLSLFWLRRLLQESPVRQRIILLDCCHSGEFLNFLEADPGARPGTDRLFMAASREYESAYESLDSPYSVFTQALLTGLDPQRSETGIITNHSLTTWVNDALKGELQQPLFENSGSEIILTRGESLATAKKPLQSTDICPYRGLEFFDEAHAEYFFGREDLTDQLLDELRRGRFVAVVGASGSGKSSLVRAGLLWELRQGKKFSGSDRWRIKLLTPTHRPLKSLASAFVDLNVSDLERAEQLRRAEVFLQDGGAGLAQLVQASLLTEQGNGGDRPSSFGAEKRPHLLLVIDQFEEVFTLSHGTQAEQERHQFFQCLTQALQVAGDCLSIVIVLRADFFGKCSLYEKLAQQIEQNMVIVTPLSYEQIKATIMQPAQKVGLTCEPNLVYTMLLDVIGAPGELPLLQYTLLELWQRRQIDADRGTAYLTLDAYTELGGVRGTLQKRATEIFYGLSLEEQGVAKRIFLALTQLGEGTEDTRRRVFKAELVNSAFSRELVEQTLEKLVAAKLVVTNQSESWQSAEGDDAANDPASEKSLATVSFAQAWLCQETIDVAHEALIRNWTLLRSWLDENREVLRRQRRIEQVAQEWNNAGQPKGVEYLLRGGRLIDAEDFLSHYSDDLSSLAQRYIIVSQEESYRARKELRSLQIAVPSVLLVALLVTFNQYRTAVQTQAEKDYQLQVSTSRERAAIAQSILQEPDSDPMTALLISRLAAEQGGQTYEAQSSLRAALQDLRLQLELHGHQAAVHQVIFSSNQNHLATASADGTIRLWPVHSHTIQTDSIQPFKILSWSDSSSPDAAATPATPNLTTVAFSPDNKQVVAIAQNSPQIKIWSVESGDLIQQIEATQAVTQVSFSPDGKWIATASTDRSISIWQAETGQLQVRLTQSGAVNSLEFSSDGQRLLSAGADGFAYLWQLAAASPTAPLTARLIKSLQHPDAVNSASFSPKGRWIATACDDGKVRLWEIATGQLRHTLTQNTSVDRPPSTTQSASTQPTPGINPIAPVVKVLFSPDEQLLATTSTSHQTWLWEVGSGRLRSRLTGQGVAQTDQDEGIGAIAFSPDSRQIITTNRAQVNQEVSYSIYLWDTQTGSQTGTLRGNHAAITTAQFSPDGAYLVTASQEGTVRLWSAELGGELPTLHIPHALVQWAAFVQPAEPLSARASTADSVPSINLNPSSMLIGGNSDSKIQPNTASAVPTGIMTVTADGALRRWEVIPNSVANPTLAVDLDQGLPSASTAQIDTSIQPQNFWQRLTASGWRSLLGSQTNSPNAEAPASETPVAAVGARMGQLQPAGAATTTGKIVLTSVAFSQNGQMIATATSDGWVEIRRNQSSQIAEPLQRIQSVQVAEVRNNATSSLRHSDIPAVFHQLVFSADGRLLLGLGDDFAARLWDVQSGQLLQTLHGHEAMIQQAQFSPDGQQIITASLDRTARIWQVASGQTAKVLSHQDAVSSAAFSPDGQQVVTTSWDSTARVTDVETGALKVILSGHRGLVLDAQFSPDGRSLVTAGADGTARIWDAETGVEKAQLHPTYTGAEPKLIRRAFFSPDGQYVATLTEQGQVNLWAATWEMLLELARDRSFRQLTDEECIRYLRLAPDNCPTLEINQD
ncbi:caspase family protein [Oculatella sp. FACHB-28]|uniref:nSTAND1 domain-containing NTPase n=1 Tax=Oculatella sp. FACHB-28 TaxID=2692845 RepID=UPI001688C5C6|nr:LpqB family beta-propeller domain-containing protein [Oculatella sp. FACHB-28]MBD2055012.1 caspase family protein [Oculatella sp. FACHB-28]